VEIVLFITAREQDARPAERFASALVEEAKKLADFPHRGKAFQRRPNVRRLVHGNYLIVYEVRLDGATRRNSSLFSRRTHAAILESGGPRTRRNFELTRSLSVKTKYSDPGNKSDEAPFQLDRERN